MATEIHGRNLSPIERLNITEEINLKRDKAYEKPQRKRFRTDSTRACFCLLLSQATKVSAPRHERTEVKVKAVDCPINQASLNAKINTHKEKKQNELPSA